MELQNIIILSVLGAAILLSLLLAAVLTGKKRKHPGIFKRQLTIALCLMVGSVRITATSIPGNLRMATMWFWRL